jgi:hypothetical protein
LFGSSLVPHANPRKQAVLGLAVLLLAGCGEGETKERLVLGTGYSFRAPTDWSLVRVGREVRVSEGTRLLSVREYALARAYRPELWTTVVAELDGAVDQLARQQAGTVSDPRTVTISGRRARSYDLAYEHEGKQLVERIAFVLRGKTEYVLLCRYERGGETRACERLLATFRLT